MLMKAGQVWSTCATESWIKYVGIFVLLNFAKRRGGIGVEGGRLSFLASDVVTKLIKTYWISFYTSKGKDVQNFAVELCLVYNGNYAG